MDQKIIADVFLRHLELLTAKLGENEAFCILSGKEEGSIKPKTKAMFIWLFGYDMIETVFIATQKQIIYLASQKKLEMMDEIKTKLPAKYKLSLIQKVADNKENFNKIQTAIAGKQILMPLHEKQVGPLSKEWSDFGFHPADNTQLIQELLMVKDDQEIGFVVQSAGLTCKLIKKLVQQIENAIDVGSKVTHHDLAGKIEKILENPTEKKKLMTEFRLQEGLYDLAYTPIIQSGGQYSLDTRAIPSKDNLSSDVILISLGTQVNEYNAACVRTLFINPLETQKKIYNLLVEIQARIFSVLVPGALLSQVYYEGVQLYQKVLEIDSSIQVPKSFGYGMGLEFKEGHLLISADNHHQVTKSEVYFVQVSAENVPQGQKGIIYTISIADLCIIKNTPEITTAIVDKAYKKISYQLQEDGEESVEVKQPKVREQVAVNPTNGRRAPRNKQIEIQREHEKQRQKHQEELAKKKQLELEQRLENDQFQQNQQVVKSLELDQLTCYKDVNNFPKDLVKGQIYIDQAKASILLPFQNGHIPFHVSCIKNVSKIDEGRMGASIRINFFTTETSAGQIQFPVIDGQQIFIKELQYRSKKSDRPQTLINQIKVLQKKVKAEQQVEREKQHTGDLEPLIQNRGGRKPIFRDLKIRPTIAQQGKGSGTLEVHTNGFRYLHQSKETVDIIFKNIKHYIYQSPEQEIIAAIHFHLHSPIVLGKKKTYDVQFYCEVGGGVEHLEGRKKQHRNDEDEIEDEERARQQRKKMAREFELFIKSIEEVGVDYRIKFEMPIRKQAFEGNWNRARIFLQPTQQTLMNVIDSPFFILTLQEVEICCFERILPGIKSFDLVFVFKNYDKPVLRVESIDIKDLENVKNWLDSQDLLFAEVAQNLVWKNVLGQIQKDIPGFVQDGGWQNFLAEDEGEGQGDDDIEEGDSEFSPGGSGDDDDDSEYSDDDDDDDAEVDDDDDEDADDDDDDEEVSDVIDLNNISEEEGDSEEERRRRKAKQQQPQASRPTHNKAPQRPPQQQSKPNNQQRKPQPQKR